MKAKTALVLLLVCGNTAAALQCVNFRFDALPSGLRVNGDPVRPEHQRFTAAPGDYDNMIITLRRSRITDPPFLFILTAQGGRVSMDYVTDENPPRVLNRDNCRGSLRALTGADK